MIEAQLGDVVRFIIQISAAVAGAASLWGFILTWKGRNLPVKARIPYSDLSRLLILLYTGAFVVFFLHWWLGALVFYPLQALAHEGIVIKPLLWNIQYGFNVNFPLVTILSIISFLNILLYFKYPKSFEKYSGILFFHQFLLLTFIISLTSFTGKLDHHQLFFSFHNWHSILTLGTVITVDFLYMSTLNKDYLKRVLYPFFPTMSAAIWIGLGIDFLSVALIFHEAFRVTTQFLFNQTVIGIIIINGALLSGKINNMLVGLIKPTKVMRVPKKMETLFGITGSISIISWSAITFLDFFTVNLSYVGLLVGYIFFIACAFLIQRILEGYVIPAFSKPQHVSEKS